MNVNERLDRIEQRLQRETDHMMNVMASQPQIVSKAFEQVQVSLLAQEMMVRSHSLTVQEQLKDLSQVLREFK